MSIITLKGWATVPVEGRSAATGTTRRYEVTFRRTSIDCCGSQERIVFGELAWPFYIDGSYGEVKPRPRQCGGCGRLHSIHYTAKEV